ncbi:MAG: toll/interleukin-1 receptor domain-containing protein [Acidobacteria bacterium]|nr:toll/interleukin-1 receptor domain-containing protein [Acidobacteriota bacterium]
MSVQTKDETATALQDEYKYWAFISYSHQDEAWASWLHKSLETYKVPRKLVGRALETGVVPRRIFPIFRDREELPGAADLGGKLKNALRGSRYLIVICSPKAAVSQWVNEEIKTYKALGREDRVLCLIVDGEPYASEKPESGLLECFPAAVRYRVAENGELTSERTEPIAADARKGKDGRTNAKFKLLAGILNVGYDELKQREKKRQTMHQLRLAAGVASLLLLAVLVYVAVADKGLNVPGGEGLRTFLDRHNASLLRPVRSEAEIRSKAVSLRQTLLEALARGQTREGWIPSTLRPNAKQEFEIWSHSQALSAAFSSPDAGREQELRNLVRGLEAPFAPGVGIEQDGIKYGWISHPGDSHTQAEPALWTAIALAKALGRPGLLTNEERQRAEQHMAYAQEVLRLYHPLDTQSAGWNMFPRQKDPSQHNTYTTALALLALLEMRAAGVPWEGSAERRDALLKTTAQWLIGAYYPKADPPGWKATSSETTNEVIDGLTLQIYSELLRAEAEAGVTLPPEIIEQMPRYLTRTVERDMKFPVASGEFPAAIIDRDGKDSMDREAIGFLWYPWAINASVRWLSRAEQHDARPEDRVRVRRALGHLVVDLGDEAVDKASEEWTFQDAETLFGMSAIPPPDAGGRQK